MKPAVRVRLEEMFKRSETLQVDDLIAEARKKTSPLHDEFEWDPVAAHPLYLRERARALIRDYWIEVNQGEEVVNIRGAFSLPRTDDMPEEMPARSYYWTQRALSNEEQRARIVDQARREFSALAAKYRMLVELRPVIDVIDRKLSGEPKKEGKRRRK